MKKLDILVPIGCRSDEGLSKPVIKRLQNIDWCNVTTIPLVPANYNESYKRIEKHLSLCKYDLVLITGDRIEMAGCAQACFLNRVKIAHLYAGIIDYAFVLFDDILRHQITLTSDIQFCESQNAKEITDKLLNSIGKKPHSYVVGISHLDDVEVDESLVLKEPYDLVLINMETIHLKERDIDIQNYENYKKAVDSVKEKYVVCIGGNPDGKFTFINSETKKYYPNLSRPQFLGLLKNCSRFITNSSCAYYEAPEWLKPEQIIMIGDRNKRRTTPKNLQKGTSDKIVDILHQLHLKGEFD